MKKLIVITILTALLVNPSQGNAQNDLTDRCRNLLSLIWASMGRVHYSYSPTANQKKFDHLIEKAGKRYGIKPALIHSVIKVESNYNPRAVSPKGARGLMQLMPETAREMQVHDIHDPEENIYGGTRYLRMLLRDFNGNLNKSLMAYNCGPNAVKRNRIPRESKIYATKVIREYIKNQKEG